MRRTIAVLLVVVVLSTSGCLQTPGDVTTRPPEPTTTTVPSSTATASPAQPTDTPVTPSGVNDSVVYRITGTALPSELDAATVTVRIVFAERGTDLGPCWADAYRGPYQPTITPIATPAGECHRSDAVEIDLGDTNRTPSPGTSRAGTPSS